MNFQQLFYFKTITEIGHMTKASEILHVSQPTLSLTISMLENELGVSLFEKRGRRIELTKYGFIFLEHATLALNEIELAKKEINNMTRSTKDMIRISSTYSLGTSLMPEIIKNFSQLNPQLYIDFKQGPNMELIQSIVEDKTDFVFSRINPDISKYKTIKSKLLYSEKLVILMNKDHRLAKSKELSLDDLKDEDFIFFHESTGYKTIVQQIFIDAGFTPHVKYEVYDNSACVGLVSANLGIALACSTPFYDRKKIQEVRLSSPSYKTDIYMIWNFEIEKHAPPIYLNFIKYIEESYRK